MTTAFDQTSSPGYSEFIQLSRYSRWLPEHGRREDWNEVVQRWADFWVGEFPDLAFDINELAVGIHNLEYMPSMRTLMTAGEALRRDHVAGYNCAYRAIGTGVKTLELTTPELPDEVFKIPLKDVRCFDEILYILMCGTGEGFSVERQYVNQLPTVGKELSRQPYRRTKTNYPGVDKEELSHFSSRGNTVVVADSKYGWASALRVFLIELYNGNFDIKHDTSRVRKAGSVLHTFGGRASGPEPLIELFEFARELFKSANGRKLNSIECHDLVCKIAVIVVVGGVRRSALISLSNLTDARMAAAKVGRWYDDNGQRAMSNNSVCYTETPDIGVFMREWKNLYDSKSGERGIFNRAAVQQHLAKFGRRDPEAEYGCNPCSEINLLDQEFCNLTEIIVRPWDTLETLKRKVKAATIIGTMQATLTNFKYLNPQWKKNCEEEALLGVSLTGIMDHPIMSGSVAPVEE